MSELGASAASPVRTDRTAEIETAGRATPEAMYDAICDRGNLTRRQLSVWAGDRVACGQPVFVEAGVLHIRGALDPTSFQRAFQAVVDESDALRLAIEDVDGWPRQRVRPAVTATVDFIDLQSSAAPERALEHLARERAATRVGSGGGLFDTALVRLARDHHVWVLAQHQLVSDAWSFRIIHERMAEQYQRARRGFAPAAGARPAFQDYVTYERRFRASSRCEAARAYWRSRYGGAAPGAAPLGSRGEVAATRICRVTRPIGHAATAALRTLALQGASADAALFSIFASLVVTYVYRSTGSREVVLSVPFANRPSEHFKRTAGSFMNVCPVRVAIESGDTFRVLIERVAAEVWEAAGHQQYAGRPGPVPQPYDVFVNVQKEAVAARSFADLPMDVTWLAPTHRFGALAVAVEDFGATGNLTLVLDCNERIFGRASRDELVRDLLRILDEYVADPGRRVSGAAAAPPAANGKVDHAGLPAVEIAAGAPGAGALPRTETEGAVAAIWCDLLGVDEIGRDEDFFALGGDSLLGYRMLARLRSELDLDVAVECFLAHPTVAGVVVAGEARPVGGIAAVALARLPRQAGVNTFRTSFAQERLWFLEQIAPGSAVYNVAGAFRAVGHLDLAVLRHSLESLVARHESLRTTFAVVDGRPLQVVSPLGAVSLPVTDLRPIGPEVERLALAREAERPFDLARGPLLRVAVLQVADDTRLVCVTMHHLIADAWSVDIFVRELAARYHDGIAGRMLRLPAPELQYADFAEWQRGQYEGERRVSLVSYWSRQLVGAPYPRAVAGNRLAFRGAAQGLDLAPVLVESVRALARREGVTLFVLTLAVWQMLLARWLAQDDVTVLSPVANRDRSEVAEIIGFFVNLVALRARWDGDPRFRELLGQVKSVVRDAMLHQELPFEMVLKELGLDRTLERPPLSPIAFAVERTVAGAITLPNVELSAVRLETTTCKTDLALIVCEHERGIAVRVEHHRDLYDCATVDHLLRAFVAGLEQVVADPARRLSELLPGFDRGTASAREERGGTVWERFLAQAERTPDGVAVRAAGEVVTYRTLAARAAAVGAVLAAHGVGRGTIVAVWGERGVGWVSALLGIFRHGAVYLPIEPRWPGARVAQVLRESGAPLVLTGTEPPAALRAAQSDEAAWEIVPISGAAPEEGAGAACAPGSVGEPTDVAYVLYTSGSTGVPKGAQIEHAGLLNHLEAKIALLGSGRRIGWRRRRRRASTFRCGSAWRCCWWGAR